MADVNGLPVDKPTTSFATDGLVETTPKYTLKELSICGATVQYPYPSELEEYPEIENVADPGAINT